MNRVSLPFAAVVCAAAAVVGTRVPAAENPAPPMVQEESYEAIETRLKQAEILAGLTPVEGPGVIVVLRHSTREVPGVEKESLQVGEQDVTAVLNALRAAGAEALAVTGKGSTATERVTATTGIVEAGETLAVNGVPFKQPYRILAVGETRLLREQLFRVDGVVKRAALDTLGMIEVHDAGRVEIPGARLAAGFRFAQPRPELVRVVRRLPMQPPARTEPVRVAAAPVAAAPESRPAVSGPGLVGEPKPAPSRPAATTPAPAAAVPEPARPVARVSPPTTDVPAKEAGAGEPAPKPAAPKGTASNPVRPAAPAAPAVEPQVTLVKGPVFGGKGLAKFHVPGCRFGERLAAPDRVTFRSASDATKDGRVPCRICCIVQSASSK